MYPFTLATGNGSTPPGRAQRIQRLSPSQIRTEPPHSSRLEGDGGAVRPILIKGAGVVVSFFPLRPPLLIIRTVLANEKGIVMAYLHLIPHSLPANKVLVHNQVQPASRLGERGFRAWLASLDAGRYERCNCGWAPKLQAQYRIAHGGALERP